MKILLLVIVIFSCNNHEDKRVPIPQIPGEVAVFDSLAEKDLSVGLMEYVDTAISYSMVSHKRLGVTYKTYHYDSGFKLHYLTEKVCNDSIGERDSDKIKGTTFAIFQSYFQNDKLFKIRQRRYKAGDLAEQTDYYIKNKAVFYKKGNQELDRKEVFLKDDESFIFGEISKKRLNDKLKKSDHLQR